MERHQDVVNQKDRIVYRMDKCIRLVVMSLMQLELKVMMVRHRYTIQLTMMIFLFSLFFIGVNHTRCSLPHMLAIKRNAAKPLCSVSGQFRERIRQTKIQNMSLFVLCFDAIPVKYAQNVNFEYF